MDHLVPPQFYGSEMVLLHRHINISKQHISKYADVLFLITETNNNQLWCVNNYTTWVYEIRKPKTNTNNYRIQYRKHIQVQNYTFLKKKNSHKSESVALKYTNVKVAS